MKELDLNEPLYSSNFAYSFFCARNAVIERQKYQNHLGENRRPPYFFTNQKCDYGSVKLQMFRKRPLIAAERASLKRASVAAA